MKEYRTDEQFQEIMDNVVNGNWTDAAQNCVDYGFYANDLLKKASGEHFYDDDVMSYNVADIALLAEMAAERRYKNV